jgi:2-methylisocitrate lyase-like PEP mutase family enzyme
MNQNEKAKHFANLHVKGRPLVLYNAWDAGSAKAIAAAGAQVIATSSWAVAEAQGYRDGEALPIELVQQIVARMAGSTEMPITVDFEGGYSDSNDGLAENIVLLLDTGIVGINFEDRVVKGQGLHSIERQADRIAAIRKAAERRGVDLFINARTDLFLGQGRDPVEAIVEALARAKAYARAGASGFFVPGLTDDALIGRLCAEVTLPINVMVMGGVPANDRLAELGVARISYGAIPYIEAMKILQAEAKKVLG